MRTANFGRSIIIPLLLFAFATWAVYLGGLAASQHYCQDGTTGESGADLADQQAQGLNTNGLQGVWGFSGSVLYCSNVYRFHWFIAAFEFLVIIGALIAAATPYSIAHSRGFWVGMFAIATLLYMIASEAWLSGISSSATGGSRLTSYRATAAGAISTVVANIACLFVIGSDWERRGAHTGKDLPGERPVGTAATTPAGMASV